MSKSISMVSLTNAFKADSCKDHFDDIGVDKFD